MAANKDDLCTAGSRLLSFFAAENNELDTLKYLVENGSGLPDNVCYYAAINNNLPMLKFAVQKGCRRTDDVCHFAAKNNNLPMLKFSVQNGIPLTYSYTVCEFAVINDNLDMLRCAVRLGIILVDFVTLQGLMTSYAAKNNNLPMVVYAVRDCRCSWHPETINRAIVSQNTQMFDNARFGPPEDPWTEYERCTLHLRHLRQAFNLRVWPVVERIMFAEEIDIPEINLHTIRKTMRLERQALLNFDQRGYREGRERSWRTFCTEPLLP